MLLLFCLSSGLSSFFFFNDTATTEIYTLSLHDALPIFGRKLPPGGSAGSGQDTYVESSWYCDSFQLRCPLDRKSTRLNSSHSQISYAVFCLKKKKQSSSGLCTGVPVHAAPPRPTLLRRL